jgi:NitT/TauT family transport system substrate-binding protein
MTLSRTRRSWRLGTIPFGVTVLLAALLAACSATGAPSAVASVAAPSRAPSSGSPSTAASAAPSTLASGSPASNPSTAASAVATVPLTVGLGYIPSVQFAPFYLAQQDGAYAAAGLNVTFQNKPDPDLITLIGQGAVDIGIADGTSVIAAGVQGIPIRYIATLYAKFPNAVIARSDGGISTPADLKGKTLGTPGRYGSSWVMLQAMLHSAGLSPSDVDVRLYPDYGQAAALAQGAVQSITGFINNEPIQLSNQGIQTTLITVDAITPLPGPGLIAGTSALANKGAAVAAFVAASLQAMDQVANDPQKGLDATFAVAPDLATDPTGQRAILDATIPLWTSDYVAAHGRGAIDTSSWQTSIAFMATLADSGVTSPVPVDQLVDGSLLP